MIISSKIVNRNKIFSRLSIVASTLIAWREGIEFFSLNMKLNVYEETEIKKRRRRIRNKDKNMFPTTSYNAKSFHRNCFLLFNFLFSSYVLSLKDCTGQK